MKSPLRTSVFAAGFVLVLVSVLVLGRAFAARRAFERERNGLQPELGIPEPRVVVAAAMRVPRTTALLGTLAEALESDLLSRRLFAATVVSYWDARPRADGLLPRPEHHEKPIDELLDLLPAIANAQHAKGELGEIVDACLVTVWDDETLRQCIEHGKHSMNLNLHRELVGILVDEDPRPKEKDGFSGLVYGYASDDALRARMKK